MRNRPYQVLKCSSQPQASFMQLIRTPNRCHHKIRANSAFPFAGLFRSGVIEPPVLPSRKMDLRQRG